MKAPPSPLLFRKARGQALLEFALGVTVLLLLIGGIVDIARIYFTYQVVSDAAREGAIFASMDAGADQAIKSRAVESTQTLPLQTDDVTVDYSGNACANNSNQVSVTVHYTLPLRMPLTTAILGSTIQVKATESALILAPPCP